MPRASVIRAATAKPGLFHRLRTAPLTSCRSVSTAGIRTSAGGLDETTAPQGWPHPARAHRRCYGRATETRRHGETLSGLSLRRTPRKHGSTEEFRVLHHSTLALRR